VRRLVRQKSNFGTNSCSGIEEYKKGSASDVQAHSTSALRRVEVVGDEDLLLKKTMSITCGKLHFSLLREYQIPETPGKYVSNALSLLLLCPVSLCSASRLPPSDLRWQIRAQGYSATVGRYLT